MSEIKYDLLSFIGRFEPWHLGHTRVAELALKQAHHLLILVGSSFQARTAKNPFTYEERREMILQNLDPQYVNRVTIRPLRDYPYNDNKWLAEVQNNVEMCKVKPDRYYPGDGSIIVGKPKKNKVGIIGYEKDRSSWYLKAFPQWDYIDVGSNYENTIDATSIRTSWLTGMSPNFTTGVLRDAVHKFMYKQFPNKEYERLAREHEVVEQRKKRKMASEHPIIDQTVDAVVVQSGHILLVKRKGAPGEGLWALPGGYLKHDETILTGMLRELEEETKLKVPEKVLRGSIRASHPFDAVDRSQCGRIITNAFLIELEAGPLPHVKGSDDAAKAKWIPQSEVEKMEEVMFEDHFHIISYFLRGV